jgi:hypothetical protein
MPTPSRHSPQYDEANGTATYTITLCLSEDDEEMVAEKFHAKDIWAALEEKYKETTASGRKVAQQYFNFKMAEGMSVRQAWTQLQTLGRRLVAAQPSMAEAVKPEQRIHQLLQGLPESWTAARDAIDMQPNLKPEEILNLLEEKETMDSKDIQDDDTAMVAKKFRGQIPSRSSRDKTPIKCVLCDREHKIFDCPDLGEMRSVLKSIKRIQSKPQSKKSTGKKKAKDDSSSDESQSSGAAVDAATHAVTVGQRDRDGFRPILYNGEPLQVSTDELESDGFDRRWE